jgi:hypothetical protein
MRFNRPTTSAALSLSSAAVGSSASTSAGLADQRAGHGDALLLPARQVGRQIGRAVGQADKPQHMHRRAQRRSGIRNPALHMHPHHHVLRRRQAFMQVVRLKDEAQTTPQAPLAAASVAPFNSWSSKVHRPGPAPHAGSRPASAPWSCQSRTAPSAP